VAIAAAGNVAVGVAGSGVWAENAIRAHVKALIDGDGSNGISATSILVKALDTSKITAIAGAAAVALAFAGRVPRWPCRSASRWHGTHRERGRGRDPERERAGPHERRDIGGADARRPGPRPLDRLDLRIHRPRRDLNLSTQTYTAPNAGRS
jgi:hypothetical protein